MDDRSRQLLFSLAAELPVIRQNLALARAIAEFPDAPKSLHPVLNFAFARAPMATVDNILLRVPEALDPLLDDASVECFNISLFDGQGRHRKAVDPVFELARQLRAQGIAHRVKLDGVDGPIANEIRTSYGSIWNFLDVVIDHLQAQLDRLDEAGWFKAPGLSSIRVRISLPFTAADIEALIVSANALVDQNRPRDSEASA